MLLGGGEGGGQPGGVRAEKMCIKCPLAYGVEGVAFAGDEGEELSSQPPGEYRRCATAVRLQTARCHPPVSLPQPAARRVRGNQSERAIAPRFAPPAPLHPPAPLLFAPPPRSSSSPPLRSYIHPVITLPFIPSYYCLFYATSFSPPRPPLPPSPLFNLIRWLNYR